MWGVLCEAGYVLHRLRLQDAVLCPQSHCESPSQSSTVPSPRPKLCGSWLQTAISKVWFALPCALGLGAVQENLLQLEPRRKQACNALLYTRHTVTYSKIACEFKLH